MKEEVFDYFIVGFGLAGLCFSEVLAQQNKKFLVFDDPDQLPSAKVAAGVFNAIVLKRFTMVNDAKAQIDLLKEFYPKIEQRLNTLFFYHVPTYRKISSIEEQHNFIAASDRPLFQEFLSSDIVFKKYKSVEAPFGYGQMKQTGYVNTQVLIDSYKEYLISNACVCEHKFDYSELNITDDFVEYQGKKAKRIVFAEGYKMKFNPFFKDLPLDGAKGELLLIQAKELDLDVILKAGLFVLPIGDNLFKIGATYDWQDKTDAPTEKAKTDLAKELTQIISCDFEIIDHFAGVRPTVKDRKPLVGRHWKYANIYLLNGLGTRGVMLGPYLSQKLFNFIEFEVPLDLDINIERIYQKSIH